MRFEARSVAVILITRRVSEELQLAPRFLAYAITRRVVMELATHTPFVPQGVPPANQDPEQRKGPETFGTRVRVGRISHTLLKPTNTIVCSHSLFQLGKQDA